MRHPIASPLTQAIVGCLSLTLALSVGTQAWAQGRQTGTLRGSAHDASDAVLPGVTVTVASQSMQGTRSAVTDMNGNYELPGLANGEYLATFTLDGFTTLETTVTIPLGGTVETNVSMQVGRVAETVQVTAVIPSPASPVFVPSPQAERHQNHTQRLGSALSAPSSGSGARIVPRGAQLTPTAHRFILFPRNE
jgi:hypothetical protein